MYREQRYSRSQQVFDVVLVFDGLRLFCVLFRLFRHVLLAEQWHFLAVALKSERIYLIIIRIEKFTNEMNFLGKIIRFLKSTYIGFFFQKTVTNRDPVTQVTGTRGGGGGSRKNKSYRTTMTMYRRFITDVAVVYAIDKKVVFRRAEIKKPSRHVNEVRLTRYH